MWRQAGLRAAGRVAGAGAPYDDRCARRIASRRAYHRAPTLLRPHDRGRFLRPIRTVPGVLEVLLHHGWIAGARSKLVGGSPEVGQNRSRHRLVRDRGQESQPPAAASAGEHIEAVRPAEQLRPWQPGRHRQKPCASALARNDPPLLARNGPPISSVDPSSADGLGVLGRVKGPRAGRAGCAALDPPCALQVLATTRESACCDRGPVGMRKMGSYGWGGVLVARAN